MLHILPDPQDSPVWSFTQSLASAQDGVGARAVRAAIAAMVSLDLVLWVMVVQFLNMGNVQYCESFWHVHSFGGIPRS